MNVHVCDAKEFLNSPSSLYDVIIIDFPDPATELLSTLYTSELFARIATFLTEDGAFVCQSNSPADAPLVYWSIGNTIEHAGLTVKAIIQSFLLSELTGDFILLLILHMYSIKLNNYM